MHTHGPWNFEQTLNGSYTILGTEDNRHKQQCVAGVSGSALTRKDPEANARLIAAAPTLLHAVQNMLRVTSGSQNWNGETEAALMLLEESVYRATGKPFENNQ